MKNTNSQTAGHSGPAAKYTRSGWNILGAYIKENPSAYIVAIFSLAASSILAANIPRIIGQFSDAYSSGALTYARAEYFAFLVFGVGAFRVFFGWIGRLLTAEHGRILTFRIREELFKKWETLTPAYYREHSSGDLLSHALSDVDVVRQATTMGINTAVSGLFMLGASVYLMVTKMHWQLAVAGLAPLLAIPILINHFGPMIKRQSAVFQSSLGGMSQVVEEIVGGIRTVKAFSNEAVVLERFHTRVADLVDQKMKFVRLSTIFGALIPLVSAFGFIAVIWYGSYLTINKTITLGNLVAFLLYLTLLRQPLEQIGNMLNTVQRASASLGRVAALLDVVPTTVERASIVSNPPEKGEIEVQDLSFRYPGAETDALSHLSFSVPAGKTLGIVGTIGSGKTTLANLILRLYEPPEGSVFVDGVDILDYSLDHLRNSISYVPQNSFLFSKSISENVAFSDDGAPDESQVIAASRISAIDADIRKFPEGYATEIGERGIRLSGGQKQRVAIARMIYRKAPIRILDDSLSAVDTKTERRILQNLSERHQGADEGGSGATIIISHRLSAVMNADEIIILDGGKIVERGTHETLLALGGTYAQLWNLQLVEIANDSGVPDQDSDVEILKILRDEDEEALKSESSEEGQ